MPPAHPQQFGGVATTTSCSIARFSADRRMLFGGRVGYTTKTPAGLKAVMQQRLAKVFRLADVPIEYVWGGFVDISMNRAPDFGRVGDKVYYLQGFSGHGMFLTGLATASWWPRPLPGGQNVLMCSRVSSTMSSRVARCCACQTAQLGMLWHHVNDALRNESLSPSLNFGRFFP